MRLLLSFLISFVALLPMQSAAGDGVLAVIVPHGFAGRLPEARELPLIFLRKKLFWDDGSRIHPVNLPADHPLRRQFSQRVLKNLPEAQAQHWNTLYYHGVFPPHVVASTEAMLRFVAETPGAIGYADACKIDGRADAVLWITASGTVTSVPPDLGCGPD